MKVWRSTFRERLAGRTEDITSSVGRRDIATGIAQPEMERVFEQKGSPPQSNRPRGMTARSVTNVMPLSLSSHGSALARGLALQLEGLAHGKNCEQVRGAFLFGFRHIERNRRENLRLLTPCETARRGPVLS